MDGYPLGSLDHNVPFLTVSGLDGGPPKPLLTDPELAERGILVRSELPVIDSREARAILRFIQDADSANFSWHLRDNPKRYRFKVKVIGREFLLPPRRARPPHVPDAPPSSLILHSPFSPLSPGSTVYPDGLIDTRWIHKHQDLLPSLCLCFYSLTSDPTLATLHDNRLKTDINAIKNALIQSGYKTRLAVVILSDESPSTVAQFQERLEHIRRSTGLDPKASLFVLPTRRTDTELEIAVDSVLTSIYGQALDYYRDLGRHVRKKKGRGLAPQPTIPPTSGTSHTLSLQGWNVRYDFKFAVFAEFRQEFDVALRSYEQAYDTLLGTDVLETIPAWEPRFNDARLLADILAIRILKCLLLTGQSTTAVRRWQSHNDRICDIVDQKGRGTQNYGWKAWQARWCTVMANLIEKVNFPELEPSTLLPFRQPEKNLSVGLQPWDLLHHSGYWYRAAAEHLIERRKFAQLIPKEDRQPPTESAVAGASRKAYAYDTYMSPEPHEEYPLEGLGTNHAQMIFDHLTFARAEFQKRGQLRASVELVLSSCRELEIMQKWQQLLELLVPLWRDMSFRTEGWWDIIEAMSWTLRKAAYEAAHKELIIAIDWELMNRNFARRSGWHYDISKSLYGIRVEKPPLINLDDEHSISFICTDFIFKHEEGKAGQTCPAQLSLTSNALPDTAAIPLKSIHVYVEGGLRDVYLEHEENPDPRLPSATLEFTKVTLREVENSGKETTIDDPEASSRHDKVENNGDETTPTDPEASSQQDTSIVLWGTQDLSLFPGQTRVFEFDIPLREPGDAKITSVAVSLDPGSFSLTYNMKPGRTKSSSEWHIGPSSARKFVRSNPQRIRILPKPPKMQIQAPRMLEQYYTNEAIQLDLDLMNGEDGDAVAKVNVVLRGAVTPSYHVELADGAQPSSSGSGDKSLHGIEISTIRPLVSERVLVTLNPIDEPAVIEVSIEVWYHLHSDPSTPIVQQAAYTLNIVSPFEANYDLLPRIHSEWPSFFDTENIEDLSDDNAIIARPRGLSQKWALITRYASFANEKVLVLDIEIGVLATQGNVTCTASKTEPFPEHGQILTPKTIEERQFDLISHKSSLDDRSPATADLSFIIKWRRLGGPDTVINVTTLPSQKFYVTVAEPRVLATVSYSSSPEAPTSAAASSPQLLFLDITIENPSSHFLTFGLTMEPSEEFAFSGAKTVTLNVLPVARRSITYRLLPLVRGTWIRPTLVVRDKYFQKVLKIIPTDGMKSDKDGVLLWVPPEEDENDDINDETTPA
ncbi:Gryzun, putative trafficking through golgi-domain-containing protein [Xylaria sp. CBS 124048]|nr:Gryzun, putative trafficking through golgi-domain-containing protein [Xylaria sp. CBS 124048]